MNRHPGWMLTFYICEVITMSKQSFIFIGLALSIPFIVGERVLPQSSPKQSGSEAPEVSTVMEALQKATSVAVFRMDGEQRKFVGTIPNDGTAFKPLLSAVQEAQAVDENSDFRPRFELTVLGVGFYWLLQYDPDLRLLVGHSLTNKRLEQRSTVRLTKRLEDILTTAQPPTKPALRLKPARTGQAQWMSLPFNFIELVEQSPLILIGTPVMVHRNDYMVPDGYQGPGDPTHQVIVYIILVERYLKDDTGLTLPVVLHRHFGGYLDGGYVLHGDPLLEIGQRYLLFLRPPRSEFAMTGIGRVRDAYPDEYIAMHPFTRTPIMNGWTKPAEPNFLPAYLFPDKKTTLIFKKEERVIAEIRAAIMQLRRR
jgi:hypothetical protein